MTAEVGDVMNRSGNLELLIIESKKLQVVFLPLNLQNFGFSKPVNLVRF